MRLAHRTIAAGIASAAVALAGCGSSSTHSTGATRTTQTGAPTSPSSIAVVPAPLAGGTVTLSRILAATDHTLAAHSYRVKANLEVAANGNTSKVTLTGAVNAAGLGAISATTAAGGVNALFRGDTVWVSATFPGFTRALPTGKSWIQGTASELNGLGSPSLQGALVTLNLLRGITNLYRAPAGTARFRFSLPLALSRTSGSQRTALSQAFRISGGGFTQFGEMSIGADGAVRTADFEADHLQGTDTVTVSDRLVIGGVNQPLTITLPPNSAAVPGSSVPTALAALKSTNG